MSDSIPLWITEKSCFDLGHVQIEIVSYEGFSHNIHYFLTYFEYSTLDSLDTSKDFSSHESKIYPKQALLRIDVSGKTLQNELDLRSQINHKSLSILLTAWTEYEVIINTPSIKPVKNSYNLQRTETSTLETIDTESTYLEEELLTPLFNSNSSFKTSVLTLTEIPDHSVKLSEIIESPQDLQKILSITSEICRFSNYLLTSNWCTVSINPNLIYIRKTTNSTHVHVTFIDCSIIFSVNDRLPFHMESNYCAPELSFSSILSDKIPVYCIGVLLHKAIYQVEAGFNNSNFDTNRLLYPGISQIINLCLETSQNRLSLKQLLSFLGNYQKHISTPRVNWDIAYASTLGLSNDRLQNEDNFIIRQSVGGYPSQTYLLAAIADGMGGLAQGEIASTIAIDTLHNVTLLRESFSDEQWHQWLLSVTQLINMQVVDQVDQGGTTLSIVLTVNNRLFVNHVGDSRISLIRKHQECQLSQDHSLVNMLFKNGQIRFSDIDNYANRSTLTKSIGTQRSIGDNYIQTLFDFDKLSLSLSLEDQDILLLYSDGIWDILKIGEIVDILNQSESLSKAVESIIELSISRGADDNATLVVLRCNLQKSQSI